MDESVGRQRWCEIQPDTEFLELNRDARESSRTTGRLQNREGKLTAGKEARVLAGLGHQVRLGEDFQNVLFLQRLDCRREVDVRAINENVKQVAEADCTAGRRCRAHTVLCGELRW